MKRLRFGLRTLLISFTAVAVAFGYFVNRVHTQSRLVQAVASLGGSTWYAHDAPTFVEFPRSTQRTRGSQPEWTQFANSIFGEESTRTLVQVEFKHLSGGAYDAVDLERLASDINRFASIETISIESVVTGDRFFEFLSQLKHVKNLKLSHGGNRQELSYVCKMQSLEHLQLSNSSIENDGLAILKQMKNLRALNIYSMYVDHEGIEQFIDKPGLRELTLHDCAISKASLAKLVGSRNIDAQVHHYQNKAFED